MYLYHDSEGKIYYAIKDHGAEFFRHSTNRPSLTIVHFDEIDPETIDLCLDVIKTVRKEDDDGDRSYRVINGEIEKNEGWVQRDEEF